MGVGEWISACWPSALPLRAEDFSFSSGIHQVALPIKQGSAGIPVLEKLGQQSFPGWDHIKKVTQFGLRGMG